MQWPCETLASVRSGSLWNLEADRFWLGRWARQEACSIFGSFGQHKGADALGVLIDDGLVDVVVEFARTVGFATETANFDGAVKGKHAVGISSNELLLDTFPCAPGGGLVALRKVAHTNAFGHGVGKHAAGRGLEVVAVRLVHDAGTDASVGLLLHCRTVVRRAAHDLPPETRFGVLCLDHRGNVAVECGDERCALRMISREPIQRVDQRHNVPAHCAGPDFGAQAGGFVGPGHLLRLVPAVTKEAGFWVPHVRVHQEELFGDIVEVFGLLERGCVRCAEGFGHESAVEPNLIRIDLLVPVSAACCARLDGKLIFEEFRRLRVFLLLGDAVDEERGATHFDVVEGVAVGFVAGDDAIGGDVFIDCGLDVGEVSSVGGGVPLGGHTVQRDAFFVGPLTLVIDGGDYSSRPLLDDGCGHLLRWGILRCCSGGNSEHQTCCQGPDQLHDLLPHGS